MKKMLQRLTRKVGGRSQLLLHHDEEFRDALDRQRDQLHRIQLFEQEARVIARQAPGNVDQRHG